MVFNMKNQYLHGVSNGYICVNRPVFILLTMRSLAHFLPPTHLNSFCTKIQQCDIEKKYSIRLLKYIKCIYIYEFQSK